MKKNWYTGTLQDHIQVILNCSSSGSEVISVEEWKRRKIIWQEENPRPNCKNCGKRIPANFRNVPVQRFEPDKKFDEEWGEMSDCGIRLMTDYSSFSGFGHRDKGIFCTGRCCESFAYKVCDHFEGVA